MRHMRKALALGAMTLVGVFALSASSALAGEFEATRNPPCSEAQPCLTEGNGVEFADPEHPGFTQQFKFGAFKVLCRVGHPFAKTAAQGAPTWTTSESFTTQVKFGRCLTEAKFGPKFEGGIKTSVNGGNPMTFTYLPNAPGKKLGELGEVMISAGSVKIGAQICTMSWGGQTVLSQEGQEVATFEPVFGEHESLIFHNAMRGIEWEYEGGQCVGEKGFEEEATTTEGKKATYNGSFKDNLKKGSLTYKP